MPLPEARAGAPLSVSLELLATHDKPGPRYTSYPTAPIWHESCGKAGCDLYAFGATAISMVGNCYAQNLKGIGDYERAVRAGRLPTGRGYRLNGDDRLRRHVMTRLLCDLEVRKATVEQKFRIDFDDYFATELHALGRYADEGLIELRPDRLVVTALGRLLVRNLAMEFDAYLRDEHVDQPLFSRTV